MKVPGTNEEIGLVTQTVDLSTLCILDAYCRDPHLYPLTQCPKC